ncbi:hypothetical protein [Streptomyces sp. NPDC056987]|uniref:hypothetical protein n=1 Tax=Streptomyces sp. NPDC056987 TaxID=3345988 RepID=UPI0036394073
MKSARMFVVTVLCAMTLGAATGTAVTGTAAETGDTGLRAASSIGSDGDTGWGRTAG